MDSQLFSKAGKIVMIKAVAQIPTYAMSIFEFLKRVCNDMDAILHKFWWRLNKKNGNCMAYKAWLELCKSKDKGGLGFQPFRDMNLLA